MSASSDPRRLAVRASWVCAVAAMALVGSYYVAAVLPGWTRGLAMLSGGVALAGAGLAALALHPDGWSDPRRWPAHFAFGFNALFAIALLIFAAPA